MTKLNAFAFAAVLAGCCCREESEGPRRPAPDSLYMRLGGLNGVARATDEMVNRILTDPVILGNEELQKRARPENVPGIKVQITNLLSSLSGGPEYYGGRSMKEAHLGMKVNGEQWSAFLKDCRAGMEAATVGAKEIEEVLAIFEGMREDIVEVK